MSTQTSPWGALAHPIRQDRPEDGTPAWKDNAYVIFWDPANEVFGSVHVSTSPNAEGRRARGSFSVRGRTAEVVEEPAPGTWDTASITFDPEGHMEVRTAEVTAVLDMVPRGAACDYSTGGVVPELVAGEPLQHFQGAILVTGAVEVHGEFSAVDGVGMRDRTWGFRDESAQFPEYYGIVVDLGGRLLTVMRFARTDGQVITDGFLVSEDGAVSVKQIDGYTRDASGLFAAAKVTTVEGEVLDLRMTRRLAGFWVPMGWERQGPTMSAYDELIEVRTAEGLVGHGMVEQGIVRRLG
ncbi:MAG: hypothetical protein JWO90_3095 [Solirubrobacterales bacterium]|nr:hypothetical protein [Solirubrobacterales bacterium]